MKMTEVYKVVSRFPDSSLHSAFVFSSYALDVTYAPGKVSTPPIGYLFAFDSRQNAVGFASRLYLEILRYITTPETRPAIIEVWSAETTKAKRPRFKKMLVSLGRIIDDYPAFWRGGSARSRLMRANCREIWWQDSVPKGTLLCPDLKLINLIERFGVLEAL